jgi:hypothetical protein
MSGLMTKRIVWPGILSEPIAKVDLLSILEEKENGVKLWDPGLAKSTRWDRSPLFGPNEWRV